MRKDTIFCSHLRRESETLLGCSGNDCQLQTSNCSQSLGEGLLERYILLRASAPCNLNLQGTQFAIFPAVFLLLVAFYLSQDMDCKCLVCMLSCMMPSLQVRLCRQKTTGKVFAMKKLKKTEMVRRGQVLGTRLQHLHASLLMPLSVLA